MSFRNKKDEKSNKTDNKKEQKVKEEYPSYEALSREDAKALLELRLKKKSAKA